MSKKTLLIGGIVVLGIAYAVFRKPSVADAEIPTDPAAIARGEYLFNAGGCGSCHQPEGQEAPIGGYEIAVEKPFPNTFYVPNITPDPETGVGGWTGKDFILALKHGRKPSGGYYWPAFPFRSYKGMSDAEVLDMAAYIMSLPPVSNQVPEHVLPAWQFNWAMAGWNILANVLEGEEPVVSSDPQVQRGAYLARVLGHCGECHTPRNGLGMMQRSQEFAGAQDVAPQIDPEGLSGWVHEDFMALLQLGMTADFETVGGEMIRVVEHTARLTEEDQEAYTAFFLRDGAAAE